MEYTKGEWEVEDWGHNKVVTIPETGKEICVISKHYDNYEANAHLIAKSPQMAEWIVKVARQDFVVFPEDKRAAKEIIQTLDLS